MPYPDSPFDDTFNTRLITNLKEDAAESTDINLQTTLKWLCTAPKITTYRVNTLKVDRAVVMERIQEQLNKVLGAAVVVAEYSDVLPEVILIKHPMIEVGEKYTNEIVVDVDCAAAVLRGAHIYAPGVLAMLSTSQLGDNVSIYADISKKCKKGLQKLYLDNNKAFIGNGIVKMTRKDLFRDNLSPQGIAIEVLKVKSGCPSLGDDFLPRGWALLQNLPSILCVNALDLNRGDVVLDMCAAPGNKTTHIAALMQNKAGTLVAIDKLANKVNKLKKTCKDFGAKALIFQADSCKIVSNKQPSSSVVMFELGPPFPPEVFDKILLDAPCSVLGKRPQFCNKTTEKVLKSYVPLQRKLFATAVDLVKPKGTLIYSTCTITLAENEGIVAWALKTFDCLELVKPAVCLGEPGWPGALLSEQDRLKIQRFGPNQNKVDSVGFFIACFRKSRK